MCGKLNVDLAELHYVVVDTATCAAVVVDDHVALDGRCAAAVRARRTTLQSRRCASFIDEDLGVYKLDSLAATVSRCTTALEFRPSGPDVSAFTEENRGLRKQTRKAEDLYAIRGRWSKRRWRTNPRHLIRYFDATLHVNIQGGAHCCALECDWT